MLTKILRKISCITLLFSFPVRMVNIFFMFFFKIWNCYWTIIVAIQLLVLKTLLTMPLHAKSCYGILFFPIRLRYKNPFPYLSWFKVKRLFFCAFRKIFPCQATLLTKKIILPKKCDSRKPDCIRLSFFSEKLNINDFHLSLICECL